MSDSRNRPDSKKATNDWLTPPELVSALGPFDLDPCVCGSMPWRTAAVTCAKDPAGQGNPHVDLIGDGLEMPWSGRVWCNPPWDDPMPWVSRMTRHWNGMMLTSAKSTDTKWAQAILSAAHAVLFFKGRLLYHYPDGRKSTGGWTPSMLAAFGRENAPFLWKARSLYPGVILTNPTETL